MLRVGDEAAVFQENLPKAIAKETLTQQALLASSRLITFGPRGNVVAPKLRTISHEVVSEYSVGHLKNSDSQNLFEFRQAVLAHCKAARSVESARREFTYGIRSQDDSVRKRMLQDYAKFGLVDVATDYGLILLAFTKRGLETMHVTPRDRAGWAPTPALALSWKQTSSDAGELEFRGRQGARQPLEGTLWVSASDGLPLRIEAWAEYEQAKRKIRDEASVDYVMSLTRISDAGVGSASPSRRLARRSPKIFTAMRPSGCFPRIRSSSSPKRLYSAAGGACGGQEMIAK